MEDRRKPSAFLGEPTPISPRSKLANTFIFGALIVIALAVGLFLKWVYQSPVVVKINNSPFPTRLITQGGDSAIVLTADYCKLQAVDGMTRTSFVSKSREIFLPASPERGPKICQKIDIPILIPRGLPADTYVIRFQSTYNLNPIQSNVLEDFSSQPIMIGNINGQPTVESVN
jgi:hypothetical protein